MMTREAREELGWVLSSFECNYVIWIWNFPGKATYTNREPSAVRVGKSSSYMKFLKADYDDNFLCL